MKHRLLTYNGVTQSVTEWALDYGVTPDTINRRLRKGWPVERTITTPMRTKPGAKLKGAYLDAVTGAEKPARKLPCKPANVRRSTDIYLTFNGQERSLGEWATLTGIKHATLRHRFKNGWPVENILSEPVSKNSRRPGVVSNFGASQGTGVGRSAQETPNIIFSKKAVNA